jgi:hypothetical protein
LGIGCFRDLAWSALCDWVEDVNAITDFILPLKFDTQSSISQIFLANSSMNSSICIGFLVEMEKSS